MNVLSVYTFIYMREKKLETRDHYIPDKLQISGLPATAIERPYSDSNFLLISQMYQRQKMYTN